MSDDIVIRLRKGVCLCDEFGGVCHAEAADEIERLRWELELATKWRDNYKLEIERLQKVVVLCPKCYEAEHGTGSWGQAVSERRI